MINQSLSSLRLSVSYALDYPLITPTTCSIGVTNYCNSQCGYCSQWHTHSAEKLTSQESLIHVFQQIKDLGIRDLMLSGGEPLLRKDIYEIVETAVRMQFQTRIITNGTLLDEAGVKRLAKAGIDRIGISLDTIDADHYRQIRGIKIEPVLRALSALNHAKDEYPSLNVVLYTTITSINVHDLLELVEYANKAGFSNYFQPVQFDEGARERIQMTLWPSSDMIEELEKVVKVLLERKARGYRIINTENYLNAMAEYFRRGTFVPGQCLTAYTRLTIDKDMGVRPCWMFEPIGYVTGNNLKTLWLSKAMQDHRKLIRNKHCPGCSFNCHIDRKYTRFAK
jgi:MoaA/NifB/PqqE/SkfB family radical SAM enzyme